MSAVWMAIDYGSRRIGLAVSDYDGRLAMPAEVLQGRNNVVLDAGEVMRAADEYDVDGFVVGLPLNMNGTEGPQAQFARRFAEELARRTGKPVELYDERLSSAAADSLIRDCGLNRGRSGKPIDNLAAQITLQVFLDSRAAASSSEE